MLASGSFGFVFWGFLVFCGVALYTVAPSVRTAEGFFRGRDRRGRATPSWMVTSSIFIAWIFVLFMVLPRHAPSGLLSQRSFTLATGVDLLLVALLQILAATAISGTMVMGLAPIFLLQRFVRYSPASFHLAFWPGAVLGLLLTAKLIPHGWAIGSGQYALLLGTNVYGLAICTAGFLLPVFLRRPVALEAAR